MVKKEGKGESVLNPIIYVRGRNVNDEINDTTADPFCGFNLGSTVFRVAPARARPPQKYVFKLQEVRLAKDFQYFDIFTDGYSMALNL